MSYLAKYSILEIIPIPIHFLIAKELSFWQAILPYYQIIHFNFLFSIIISNNL
jgi:hypothetical protein